MFEGDVSESEFDFVVGDFDAGADPRAGRIAERLAELGLVVGEAFGDGVFLLERAGTGDGPR